MRDTINIADKTKELDVDSRLVLKNYYRTADLLLKQAQIYRDEENSIDYYILLLRFSSLVSETIPDHRDFRLYPGERKDYTKRLVDVITELEKLKPEVEKQVDEYNNNFHRLRQLLPRVAHLHSALHTTRRLLTTARFDLIPEQHGRLSVVTRRSQEFQVMNRHIHRRRVSCPQLISIPSTVIRDIHLCVARVLLVGILVTYAYIGHNVPQTLLAESIAVVMAPTDARRYGIFRLADPGGVQVIKQCQERGFHPYDKPADGGPIYEHCSHVYMDPNLQCDIMDLRAAS